MSQAVVGARLSASRVFIYLFILVFTLRVNSGLRGGGLRLKGTLCVQCFVPAHIGRINVGAVIGAKWRALPPVVCASLCAGAPPRTPA